MMLCPSTKLQRPVRAVILDKDGTMVDFERTWNAGYRASAEAVAAIPGCKYDAKGLLKLGGMHADTGRVDQHSPLSEGTGPEIAKMWSMCFGERPQSFRHTRTHVALSHIIQGIWSSTLCYTAQPLGDITETLKKFHGAGIKLACVTNDTERDARLQLEMLGVMDLMGSVIGYDSGFGGKPAPAGILAACEQLGVHPSEAIMVGDSPGDIEAGAAAGCVGRVAVNSAQRGPDARLQHPDATHYVESCDEMLALLGLETDHHGLDSLDYAAAVSVEHELRSMSHEKLVQLLLQQRTAAAAAAEGVAVAPPPAAASI